MHSIPQQSTEPTFDVFGVEIQFLVAPTEGTDQLSLIRGTIPPGVVVPLHSHAEPELLFCLEGSLDIFRGTGEPQGWTRLRRNETFTFPAGVKHALRNSSSSECALLVTTQGSLFNFFRAVAQPLQPGHEPAPPSPEVMQQLFAAADRYRYWMASPEENAAIGLALPALPA